MSEDLVLVKGREECPKLDGTNWYIWKRKFRALCLKYRCWEAIDGWNNELIDYGAEVKRRKSLSDRCLGLIIEHVADAYQDIIDDCEEASEAYEKLKSECTSYTALHIVQFLDDLVSVKKKDNMSMQQYIAEINSHFRKLTECEEMRIPDSVLAGLYLRGLRGDARYESFIRSLELGAQFVSEEIRGKLVLEEMRVKSMEVEEENAVALKAQKIYPKKKAQEPNQSKPFKPGSSYQGNKKFPDSRSTEKRQDRNGRDRFYVCYCCGKKGHRSFECPENEENQDDDKKKEDEPKKQEPKKRSTASVVNREYKALCASSSKITSNQGVWMLDGGASDHMTSRKDLLRDYVPMSGEVSIGDGSLLKIAGKGRMLLKISEECGGYDLDFSDVLHVPELSDNLVSQGVLDNKGMKITTFKGRTEIYDGEDLFLKAHKVGTLYFITTTTGDSIEDLTSRYQEARKKASLVTLGTWHNRLGHPHEEALLKIPHIAENFSSRMKGDCVPCIKGKMKRSNVPKEGESKAKVVLARISSDVCGPIKPTSRGGNKYVASFLDNHTNYVVTVAMKKKNEVFPNFVKYQRRVENMHNKKIMEIQTDNGGEYINHKFRSHLEEHGIFHRTTVPDHSHQNGKAERQNFTLLNSVRCLLFTSGLPLYFWAEALQTATTLRNFCPSKSIDNKIPYELWNETEVTLKTLKRLKTFGCQAWAAVGHPGKLEERAEECVFIGYPEGVKGYKLYSLKRQKIFLSNDVHFNEKIFPFLLRKKTQEEPEDLVILFREPEAEDETDSEEDERWESGEDEPGNDEEEKHFTAESGDEEYFSGAGSGDEEELVRYQEEIEAEEEEEIEDENRQENPPEVREEEIPEEAPQVRRSGRNKTEKPACTLPCCMLVKKYDGNITIPKTLAEALTSSHKEEWIAAMEEEMRILEEMRTWKLVEKTDEMNIVGCRWVYAVKRNHAEYFAMYEVCVEVEWLKMLLCELGQSKFVECPITIFADNTAAIKLALKEGHSERTRSINVKYHYSRELVKREIVKFCHVKSIHNVADLFTKVLSGVKTKQFAVELGLY